MTDKETPTLAQAQTLQKDTPWSDEEALALCTTSEGIETCCGSPMPFDVETRADRVRWSQCVRGASIMMGEPACSQGAGQIARMMLKDRETYGP
jgi:hypothetical protein